MNQHLHHCPHCNKEFFCGYKKCEGEPLLWDSECKAPDTIRNHWSEIRRLGHTSISLMVLVHQKQKLSLIK